MTSNAPPKDANFKIRGSSGLIGLILNKSVAISGEGIQIVKHSGDVELSCPFGDTKLACCEHWELRAGVIGPVISAKLTIQLLDANGELLKLKPHSVRWYQAPPPELASILVDNFTPTDVRKVADAILAVRPDLLVVLASKTLTLTEARNLMSDPTGNWKCPHCKELNPISRSIWKLQQAWKAGVEIPAIAPAKEEHCTFCNGVVDGEKVVRGKYDPAPQTGGCFIATAALGSPSAQEVVVLQRFRDQYMRKRILGRFLIVVYNRLSPPIAAVIGRHPRLRAFIRASLVYPAAAAVSKLTSRDCDNK